MLQIFRQRHQEGDVNRWRPLPCFDPLVAAQVPKKSLTVGVGTVMDAREVLLIATGSSKAVALAQTIEGSVNHMCTSSALQVPSCSRALC
jgi:6-phosphogluconolactonase/glucosamine-6-phosphate isomerase/deaminase